MNCLKNVYSFQTTITNDLVKKKLNITQKLMKLKRKYLNMINSLLLMNLIS